MTGGRVRAVVRATVEAAGPQFVALCAFVTVPALLFFVLLTTLGIASSAAAPVYWAGVLLPVSLLMHELAHAIAAVLLLGSADGLEGRGTWHSATIVRPARGARADALIALAGPAAGVACAVPVILVAGSPILSAIWAAPFLTHLVSLRPAGSDGRQVLGALSRRNAHDPR